MYKKLFFGCLIIAAITFFVMIRSEKGNKIDVQIKSDSFFEGLKIVSRNNGKAEWVLWAKRADLTRDGKEATLSDVEMKLQNRDMSVKAAKGVYNMETRQISIEGSLQATNKNYTFTTDHASINGTEGNFETSGDVKIEGRNFELQGKGMQADNNKHKVRILKNVKATFNR